LAGAPALVMAVDRYADCVVRITDRGTSAGPVPGWHFSSSGFMSTPSRLTRAELIGAIPPDPASPAHLAWQVLAALDTARLPAGGVVTIDTRSFYQRDQKLGVGSSAAVCVALYGAYCATLGLSNDPAQAAAIHHRLQGGQGSGIDIAAACFGGLLRFERPAGATDAVVAQARLPEGLQVGFVWVGHAAQTTSHLQRFAAWRERGGRTELEALTEAARALFETEDWLPGLQRYVHRLQQLDAAAGLGIYENAHSALDRVARMGGVVYKPCGAGGGDIGAAFSFDLGALERFMTTARDRGFTPIKLETAAHGIQVSR
jgi:phosphomevalonate kinase